MLDKQETVGLADVFETTRLGRILVTLEAIRQDPATVARTTSHGIVLKAMWHQNLKQMEYLLASDLFDELDDDEFIPLYHSIIKDDGSIEFNRGTFKRKIKESVRDEIMATMIENNVNFADFKSYMMKCSPLATEDDFHTYDETFLDALKIYINRRDKDGT